MKNITDEISLDTVHTLLLDYNVPSHLIGFNLLAEAVAIKICNPYAATKDIYATLAVKHDKASGSVIRDIGYAIRQANDLGKMLRISEQQIFGSRVISILAIQIKAKLCHKDA